MTETPTFISRFASSDTGKLQAAVLRRAVVDRIFRQVLCARNVAFTRFWLRFDSGVEETEFRRSSANDRQDLPNAFPGRGPDLLSGLCTVRWIPTIQSAEAFTHVD